MVMVWLSSKLGTWGTTILTLYPSSVPGIKSDFFSSQTQIEQHGELDLVEWLSLPDQQPDYRPRTEQLQ